MDYTTHYQSPLGAITLASDGEALVGLWFDGQKYFADALGGQYEERNDVPVFDDTRRWLDTYFSGKAPDFTPRLSMRAGDFRRRVWEIMLTIPFGCTMTYGDIGRQIARERGIPTMSTQKLDFELLNFMRKLFEEATRKGANFFDDYLEPLFYDALNVNRGEQGYDPALHCRIPFLL